mmetsp:Transcript_5865/g.14896  ORF Transcript_5865/g.14896 Transcript_5865/m.14896 type:complete len:382 (-) Transcript_5865:850-1995(-)
MADADVLPDEDGPLGADGDNLLAVGRELDLGDGAAVALAHVVAVALVVPPDLDVLVPAARHHHVAGGGDVQGVELGGVAAVQDTDRLPVKGVPPRHLPVGASGDDLALVGMVRARLEERGGEQRVVAGEAGKVPNDGAAVGGGADALAVVAPQRDAVHGPLVLLHARHHGLALGPHAPHAHVALLAARDDARAVVGGDDGRHGGVCVVDGVEQAPALRGKGADLAVGPPADDGPAVRHKRHALALHVGHLDAQQLARLVDVPHADVAATARGEHLAVPLRERDVVDGLVVARLDQLAEEALRGGVLQVVDVARLGAAVQPKAAVLVHAGRHHARGHAAHQLGVRQRLHGGAVQHGHAAVAAAQHQLARGGDGVGDHTLGDP